MNTKHCVYRNCGNTSVCAPKLTFFGFPLKDAEKSAAWAKNAGCEEMNLKNKYLCENHFSTIYISKTPRRTVLLPNAMPYRYDDNINKNENENYDDDFNSEKNTSREEILLDDENDIIEMLRHEDETEENVETLEDPLVDEDVQNVNTNIKIDPEKVVKVVQKTYDNTVGARLKNVEKNATNRVSLAGDEFVNHVTKRQKLHTSADNIIVANQPSEIMKTKCTIEEDKNVEIDNTVDNPDITTFIYKGEEYIQMPKRIYLEQRAKLDADVKRFRKYRNILQDIKTLVNSAD